MSNRCTHTIFFSSSFCTSKPSSNICANLLFNLVLYVQVFLLTISLLCKQSLKNKIFFFFKFMRREDDFITLKINLLKSNVVMVGYYVRRETISRARNNAKG